VASYYDERTEKIERMTQPGAMDAILKLIAGDYYNPSQVDSSRKSEYLTGSEVESQSIPLIDLLPTLYV